ncbi:MAG: TylF/MycF/NovP-related O-methyltransferase [Acidobacteriota bacterium]
MSAETSTNSAAARYLELLKHALAFTLWPEPHRPLEAFNPDRPFLKRTAVAFVAKGLQLAGYQLVQDVKARWEDRRDGSIWPQSADTMMGLTRLNHLQHCVETVLQEGIRGDLIETGVWRGGGCILMRGVLAAYEVTDRTVYVADSFQGFPPIETPQDAEDDPDESRCYLAVSESTVRKNFERYGLLDNQVAFLSGWFKDTLPIAPIEQLAILRLDGDMYGSTMVALTALYPKLSSGGFCIVDDYGAIPACKLAITDYRAANGITTPIEAIDWTGVFWRKA